MSKAPKNPGAKPSPQPEPVAPGPAPVTFNWQPVALDNGAVFVEITAATRSGVGVYYLPPAMAHGLAQGIENAATAADEASAVKGSGIIVPGVDVSAVLRSLENGGKPRGEG